MTTASQIIIGGWILGVIGLVAIAVIRGRKNGPTKNKRRRTDV